MPSENFHTSVSCDNSFRTHWEPQKSEMLLVTISQTEQHAVEVCSPGTGWHELAQFLQVHCRKLLQLLPIKKCCLQVKEAKVLCISERAVRHTHMHTSVLWGDFILCSHYLMWLLWENSACFWRTCTIPSCCLNSWDAGKAATTHRMYSSTSLGSSVKPDVHIQRNNIWDDWTDWVGGQVEDPPREIWLMKNWQPHESFCCTEFLVIAPWCRSESLHLHPPARRYPKWIYWAGRTAGMRGEEITVSVDSYEHQRARAEFILWIYGSKPTPTPTTVFSTDALRSLLCLWTQVSQ